MTRLHAADDFAVIRARLKELRRERELTPAQPETRPLPPRPYHTHIVNYADDFVILSQRSAAEALAWTQAVTTKLGLTLNGAKTSVRDARTERFDFSPCRSPGATVLLRDRSTG